MDFLNYIKGIFGFRTYSYAKVNCYIKHLKDAGKLEEDFPEHVVEVEEIDCEKFVKDIQNFYFTNCLKACDKLNVEKSCIAEGFKSKGFVEEAMREKVYELSTTMSAAEKAEKIQEAERAYRDIADEVIDHCMSDKAFSDAYDKMVEEFGNPSEVDEVEDYCLRKYAVDNKLIDPKAHKVVLNPQNIDVSCVNCEEKLTEAFNLIEEITKGDASLEFLNLRRENFKDFNNLIVKSFVLNGLKLSNSEKEKNKKDFVDFLHKIKTKE